MTDTERAAIVSRVLQHHLSDAFVSEERMRIAANEIRKGFYACDATPDEIAGFIGHFILAILESPTSREQRHGAIRAVADGFNVDIIPGEVTDDYLTVTVKQRTQH
jgi:hypothetical protein